MEDFGYYDPSEFMSSDELELGDDLDLLDKIALDVEDVNELEDIPF
jgi:hypothetical protein